MKNMTKILIGAGIAAVGAGITAYYIALNNDKQEVTDGKGNVVGFQDKEGQITTAEEEDRSFIKKIKRYVHKKFVKALAWVTIHMEQIEAIGAVIGLAGTVISISSAIRDFAKGYEVDQKLNKLDAKIEGLNELERKRINNLGTYTNDMWSALDNNLLIVYDRINDVALEMKIPERGAMKTTEAA